MGKDPICKSKGSGDVFNNELLTSESVAGSQTPPAVKGSPGVFYIG